MQILKNRSQFYEMLGSRVSWLIGFVVLIWAVEIVNTLLGHRLSTLGLYPRTLSGFLGIFLAPFLHYGIGHVLANTIPFLVLGALVLLRGERTFLEVSLFVVTVGGFAVWLIGRPAYHVGASGLVMGYFGYLLARGWYERTGGAILIAVVALLLYGGLMLGLLPLIFGVSWEMHLFGFLSGILAARMMGDRRDEPAHAVS